MPAFENDENPKRSRFVHVSKKREGWMEVDESRKDADYQRHRYVHVTRS